MRRASSYAFVALSGIVLIAFAVYTGRLVAFRVGSLTARGEVVAIEPGQGARQPVAVVAWQTADGKARQLLAETRRVGLAAGETVDVVYHPNDPQKAQVDVFWRTWALPGLLITLGTAGLALSVRRLRKATTQT